MNSDDGTDCATGRATRPASPDRTEGGSHREPRERRHPIAEQSDQWQQPVATTSGNSEPLSHVDDDGTDSPPRLPGHRASGGMGRGPTARARSRERPRRSPSRRTDSQRRPPGPRCPGSWLRSNGAAAQSPDPPQGPAKPPVQADRGPRPSGHGPSGRFTGGPRAQARPPPESGAMPCLRGA